jgi:hypothetical protein
MGQTKQYTPELFERRVLRCLLRRDPRRAEVYARHLIESAPDGLSGWTALKGALESQGKRPDADGLRAAAGQAGASAAASVIERAAGYRLGERGVIFDPEGRYRLRPMAELLREVRTDDALRTEENVVQFLDRGGDLVVRDPVLELGGAGEKAVRLEYRTAPKFIASIQNAAVVGEGLVLTQGGEFIQEIHPPIDARKYGARLEGHELTFKSATYFDGRLPLKVFDTPAFMMAGPTDTSFGDWIGSFAPRLALYEAAGLDCPILIRWKPPEQILPLLEVLGVGRDRLIFHTTKQVSIFPKLFAPSWPRPDKAAPMAGLFDVYRRAAAAEPANGGPAMIYLTRRGVRKRPLLNEPEICELFADRGFQIVNPGEMSFQEVRRLFASPACVAGPFGSAFHNLVLSRNHPTSLVLMPAHLPFHLMETAMWQAGCGNRFAYVYGETPPGPYTPRTPWTISIEKVERALDRMLALIGTGETVGDALS